MDAGWSRFAAWHIVSAIINDNTPSRPRFMGCLYISGYIKMNILFWETSVYLAMLGSDIQQANTTSRPRFIGCTFVLLLERDVKVSPGAIIQERNVLKGSRVTSNSSITVPQTPDLAAAHRRRCEVRLSKLLMTRTTRRHLTVTSNGLH